MIEECKNAIKDFKEGLKRSRPNDYEKLASIKDEKAFEAAVDLAYGDAKRTMTGIGKHEKEKNAAITEIRDELRKYFFEEKAPEKEEDFDKKHSDLCAIWCRHFSGSDLGTYGKAQKIINMSFKYLLCCGDSSEYQDYFKYCHMPLDSFTLEWFKRNVPDGKKLIAGKKLVAGKMSTWSRMENHEDDEYTGKNGKKYYSYQFYVKNIRKYIKGHNSELSPLELEFIEWPKIQLALSAEGFLFGLKEKEELGQQEKNEIIGLSLDEKYRQIYEILKDRGYDIPR